MRWLRWYILGIILWLLQGCGNPTSFKSNIMIDQLETNLDKNITIVKDEDNTTLNLVKALKSIKEEWGQKYVESVESKNKRHLFVTVYDGFYTLYDYDINIPHSIKKTVVVKALWGKNDLLKVYPLGGNKLIYIIYSDYHIRICIYDYLLHKIIKRYEYIGKENSIDKFYLEPHGKYFVYNGKQIDISDIYPTIPEEELIKELGDKLTDLYISSDRKYAYVVVKSDQEWPFGPYMFDLYKLGINNRYIKKDEISSLRQSQLLGVIDLLDDKMAYFEFYNEGELYINTYDCQFGEMIGYAPMENLYQNDLYDMYLSKDGNRIEFYGHEYYKNFYIDLTNIYHPSMIIEYQDNADE